MGEKKNVICILEKISALLATVLIAADLKDAPRKYRNLIQFLMKVFGTFHVTTSHLLLFNSRGGQWTSWSTYLISVAPYAACRCEHNSIRPLQTKYSSIEIYSHDDIYIQQREKKNEKMVREKLLQI